MKLKDISLDKLSISKLNMRAKDNNPDISDILPSIRENGVHQSLLVRPEGDGYGVVAGRRRYYALLKVAEETGRKLKAPCGILDSGDDAVAIEASLIENMARLPATELEQFAAFKALKVTGRTVADIAHHFGVTELKVKRILALANLKPAILKMYETGDIDIPSIRLLTMASKSKQAAWLKLAKDEEQDTPTGHWLKSWLLGEEQIHTKHALFDVKDYKGAILTDLFGETAYFADPDKFWDLQNTKIAEAVADTYMAAVSWRYPHEALKQIKKAIPKKPRLRQVSFEKADLDFKQENLRFDYTIKGDNPNWRPTRVFDDGKKVFIEFPKSLAVSEAPPLFVTDRKGKKSKLVNYRVNGEYYVVDRLFDFAELRLGEKKQQVVRIERQS